MTRFAKTLGCVGAAGALMAGLTAMTALPAGRRPARAHGRALRLIRLTEAGAYQPGPAGLPAGSQPAAGHTTGAAVNGSLADVTMRSAADGWAVGSRPARGGRAEHTLIEHWDGAAWSTVASPNPGPAIYDTLTSVDAVAADDAWAAGYYFTRTGDLHPLILHWNGVAWSAVGARSPAERLGLLQGVTLASATDGWAVGSYCVRRCRQGSPVEHTLIAHWDGRTWARVASPNPGSGGSFLGAAAAVSATDAWAAGSSCTRAGKCASLILHWNGATWSRVPSPDPKSGSGSLFLYAMTAPSVDDAWAAGTFAAGGGRFDTLILHWNGAAWSRVASPSPGPRAGDSVITGITALSGRNAWATGSYCARQCTQYSVTHTLILHWDGATWSRVASPDPGNGSSALGGADAVSAANAWAVGSYCRRSCEISSRYHPLILHWDGKRWSRVTR